MATTPRPPDVSPGRSASAPSGPHHADPDFTRAGQWLADPPPGEAVARVLGVPFSGLSISRARCDLLPAELRSALWSFSTYLPERGVELSGLPVADLGDVALDGLNAEESLGEIERVCLSIRGQAPVAVIGGDNSITAPAMLGLLGAAGALLTFDAHHDVRNYSRDGLTNGSPVRVLLDAGVDGTRIRQIGIVDLANSRTYSEFAAQQGVRWVTATRVARDGIATVVRRALSELGDAVYVDVDVDVVERAMAPGAPGAQPGGLSPRDLAEAAFICGSHPCVRALDIVEVDPLRDVSFTTVRLAAMVLLHFLAGVAVR